MKVVKEMHGELRDPDGSVRPFTVGVCEPVIGPEGINYHCLVRFPADMYGGDKTVVGGDAAQALDLSQRFVRYLVKHLDNVVSFSEPLEGDIFGLGYPD